jgi:hypothetical protein
VLNGHNAVKVIVKSPLYCECFLGKFIHILRLLGGQPMDIAFELIESMLVKFRSEKKWTLQALEQLSEEDITWSPTSDSNSMLI